MKNIIYIVVCLLSITYIYGQQNKKIDLYQLTKILSKHNTTLEQYKLRLITKKATIYGPNLIGIARPDPLKVVLSFNSFVSDKDQEITNIEIYNEENQLIYSMNYEIKLKKYEEINFFFTINLDIKLEHKIR